MQQMGGVDALKLDKAHFRVSDDTILHLANAECLVAAKQKRPSAEVYLALVNHFKEGMHDMKDRAPGNTTIQNVAKLSRRAPDGYRIPFNPKYILFN